MVLPTHPEVPLSMAVAFPNQKNLLAFSLHLSLFPPFLSKGDFWHVFPTKLGEKYFLFNK